MPIAARKKPTPVAAAAKQAANTQAATASLVVPSAAQLADFNTLVESKFGEANPLMRDWDQLYIDLQGSKGKGKSTFICGNPRALIAKLPDDTLNAMRRNLARAHKGIRVISTLGEFEDFVAASLTLADKYGPESPWRTFCVDSTYVLSDWLLEAELALANEIAAGEHAKEIEWKRIPAGTEYKPWKSIRDVPNAEKTQYPKVAKMLGQLGKRFTARGWGFISCTHIQPKIAVKGTGFTAKLVGDVLPDLPGSHAREISKCADIVAIIETMDVGDASAKKLTYVLNYFSSRLPMLTSGCVLPDYNNPKEDQTATGWAVAAQDWVEARTQWAAQEEQFLAAMGGQQ